MLTDADIATVILFIFLLPPTRQKSNGGFFFESEREGKRRRGRGATDGGGGGAKAKAGSSSSGSDGQEPQTQKATEEPGWCPAKRVWRHQGAGRSLSTCGPEQAGLAKASRGHTTTCSSGEERRRDRARSSKTDVGQGPQPGEGARGGARGQRSEGVGGRAELRRAGGERFFFVKHIPCPHVNRI